MVRLSDVEHGLRGSWRNHFLRVAGAVPVEVSVVLTAATGPGVASVLQIRTLDGQRLTVANRPRSIGGLDMGLMQLCEHGPPTAGGDDASRSASVVPVGCLAPVFHLS